MGLLFKLSQSSIECNVPSYMNTTSFTSYEFVIFHQELSNFFAHKDAAKTLMFKMLI